MSAARRMKKTPVRKVMIYPYRLGDIARAERAWRNSQLFGTCEVQHEAVFEHLHYKCWRHYLSHPLITPAVWPDPESYVVKNFR
jgi:hypothetical protein